MELVDHWVVGFSGKRQLNDPERVRLALREILQELRSLTQGQLVAMSSAAIGADLLFATEATELGIPWICVLPVPEKAFFNERDFPDPSERQMAREKAGAASDCEVVTIPSDPEVLKDSTWRRGAFAEAGFRCVDEADLVITVLHDAEPGKPGGTGDVVAHARAAKRPLVLIDPDTVHVRRENWPTRLHDPLTERLRRLPSGSLMAEERDKLPTPAAIRMAEWRSGFARAARKHVPGIRWATSWVVILHALATIITASVFLLLHPVNFDSPNFVPLQSAGGSPVVRGWEVIAFVFVLTGFCFLVWLLWTRPQINAANYRLAAEVGRSIIATWLIPDVASEIISGVPHGFTHFARTLLLHQRLDPDRSRRGTDEIAAAGDIEKLAAAYVDQRINPEIKYYSEKYHVSARRGRALEIGSIVFSLVAVVSAAFLAFGRAAEFHRALWGLAKLAAATAAPVTVSMLVIHEVKRREARYQEMQHTLEGYAQRILQARTMSALQDLVADVERMLLAECYEWWVLAKSNVAA